MKDVETMHLGAGELKTQVRDLRAVWGRGCRSSKPTDHVNPQAYTLKPQALNLGP